MSEELAKRILERVEQLPPFSYFADRALAAEREKSLSGDGDTERGFHDPSFARQVLHMTNFTAYSFGGFRAGFFESDSFMPEDVLRGVMLSFPLQQFIGIPLSAYRMAKGELWEHSMNCGLSAWMIASKVGYENLEAAFVAGMMHDIGKVVMDEFLPAESDEYVDIITNANATPVEAERRVLGIDHAEVGEQIAARWAFAANVIEAIRYHHQPELAEVDPDLATIVHLADCISVSLNVALSGDGLIGLLAGDFSEMEFNRP